MTGYVCKPMFSADLGIHCWGVYSGSLSDVGKEESQPASLLVAVVCTEKLAARVLEALDSDQFPTQLVVDSSGKTVPVVLDADLTEAGILGQWDERVCEIRMARKQPKAQMYTVLLHEMLHMAETQIIANHPWLGRIYDLFFRRTFGEKLVEQLSCYLFQWLGCSGMLRGVSAAEAFAFVSEHSDEEVV